MFYILGTVWRYPETGFFSSKSCPSCHQYVEMHEVVPKRYFSIFWIPLFPVGNKAPLLECPICHERFYSAPTDNKYRHANMSGNKARSASAEVIGVIPCKSCGQKLRIPQSGSYRCPKCKTIGRVVGSSQYGGVFAKVRDYARTVRSKKVDKNVFAIGLVVIAFIVVVVWAWRNNRTYAQPVNINTAQTPAYSPTVEEQLSKKPLPQTTQLPTYSPPVVEQLPEKQLPQNGSIRVSSGREGEAPFKITTKRGAHNLIKLINLDGSRETITIFIRDGETVEVHVPVGIYVMKIASGNKWYGYGKYFGREGSYSKAQESLTFAYESNGISGNEVTLYGVLGGNLKTTETQLEEF